jgi:hypothetical protein
MLDHTLDAEDWDGTLPERWPPPLHKLFLAFCAYLVCWRGLLA